MDEDGAKRAVGYSRTSGEAQRDNTSIPSQKATIEAKAKAEGWVLTKHYVDEARSGAKIAGREDFQQLMRDAAQGKFDLVLVYKVDRWGRDGAEIIQSAQTLRRDFGVDVVDTTGVFDTRDPNMRLMNFVGAGIAEQERLTILQRTMAGRIAKAKAGLPWSGRPPIGRAYDKKTGRWYVTDGGKAIRAVLERNVEGEPLEALAEEYGIANGKRRFSRWINEGQLSGVYKVHFEARDIGLDEVVEVPAIPEVVPSELMRRVKAQRKHNQTFNRTDAKQYPLGGFIYCARCGKALTGHTTHIRGCLLYTSPSPRDLSTSRMPSSA